MEGLSVKEIVSAVKGKLLCGDENIVVTFATTNSKEVVQGTLFVPVIGDRVDGHKFISSAFQQGAVATFTQKHKNADRLDKTKVYIQVENTVLALQQLGAYYRSKFDIPVIGITGSVGKTTTKEMIAAALGTKLCVLKTEGNMNSQIGLPLMMLRFNKCHEIAVIEMGISQEGEMVRLANIAQPSTAVVTNIGVSHIGQLGTQENIRKEKLNLTNQFSEGSVLYLNGDDELLKELKDYKSKSISLSEETKEKLNSTQIVYFGTEKGNQYEAKNIRTEAGHTYFQCRYPGGEEEIELSVLGAHNIENALVAIAIARQFGVEPAVAKEGLRMYQPISMRGQIHSYKGIKIIDDTYNASPDSMKSGIGILLALDGIKRRIAVLADVLELGAVSEQCHYEVGAYLGKLAKEGKEIDELITVGIEAKSIGKGAEEAGVSTKIHSFQNNEEAVAYLKTFLQFGDAILVKGSRGMHTEDIIKSIIK